MFASEGDESGSVRSPRYPAISLPTAVEKAKAIYAADKTAGSPILSALKHMGYKSRSGPANTTMAAMKRFGLIETRSGRVHLTQLAVSLCVLPAGDPRQAKALQEAALSPDIYRDLYGRFRESGLPSRETLEHELLLDGAFNHNSVPGFVNDFLETLDFAGLTGMEPIGSFDAEKDVFHCTGDQPHRKSGQDSKQRIMTVSNMQDVYSLSEGDVTIEYPTKLTRESVDEIKDWFALVLRKLNRLVKDDDSPDVPPE